MQLQAFLARSNLCFPSENPRFSGSNKRNKQRARKFPEALGEAEMTAAILQEPGSRLWEDAAA